VAKITLIDAEYHDGTSVGTLRMATQGYVTPASGAPAHTFYEGRLKQPGNTRRELFDGGKTFGKTRVGYGEISLVNVDGALDSFVHYSFSGRPYTITEGIVEPGSAAVFTVIQAGVIDQATFSWGEVSLRVKDRQQDLQSPLEPARYDHALDVGLPESGAASMLEIRSQSKPVILGKVYSINPPLIKWGHNIWQLSTQAILSIDAGYVSGILQTAGANYSTQTELETISVSAGQYRAYHGASGAYVRFSGVHPSGLTTIDATEGATAADRYPAQLIKRALLIAGVSAGDIDSGDVTDLDMLAPFECGVFVDSGSDLSTIAVLDALANSAGAWWGVDRLNKFRMRKFIAPDLADSIGVIQRDSILSIDRISGSDPGGGVPVWRVKVLYKKMWYYHKQDFLGPTIEYRTERTQEYRSVEASNPAIKSAWKNSTEMVFETVLISETDAQAEADRRLALYSVPRDTYRVTIARDYDQEFSAIIDLGSAVELKENRFDLTAGKPFVVIAIETDLERNRLHLTIWG
jgi:hypothetical protein